MDIHAIATRYQALLREHYEPGFGIMPSADPSENFYRQVWTRDFAHAAANYFVEALPQAVEDSLTTILRHQRADGALPLRVEKEYLLIKLVPGLRILARSAFVLFEEKLKHRLERPVYTGQDFTSSEDTIPSYVIAAGSLFVSSAHGRGFVEQHLEALQRACTYFAAKMDSEDALISVPRSPVDWADSIVRGGKLGLINVLWVQALEYMSAMLSSVGDKRHSQQYRVLYAKAKAALTQKLYCKEDAYFRTGEREDCVDTAASILGSLFFLDVEECVRVQEALKRRVHVASGFSNFDPPYPVKDIMWTHRLFGHQGYHNSYVWPWVACQNIFVKIKIAEHHSDVSVRDRFKREAIDDLYDAALLFEEAGGAYEIFFPTTRKPAITRLYRPPRNLLANLAGFEGAYLRLRVLGWLTPETLINCE